jgi:hypothetical protein
MPSPIRELGVRTIAITKGTLEAAVEQCQRPVGFGSHLVAERRMAHAGKYPLAREADQSAVDAHERVGGHPRLDALAGYHLGQ